MSLRRTLPPGLAALASRDYRKFAGGYAVSSLGTWMRHVAFGWLAWSLTQSPFWLGTVAFAEFLPILLVTPFLGSFLDRVSRKKVVIATEVASLGLCAVLLVLVVADRLTIASLLGVAFAAGAAVAIGHPAQLSWYPALLRDRAHIASAANIYILSFNIARFVGAALAGIVIARVGIEAAVGLVLLGHAAFTLILALISAPPGTTPPAGRESFAAAAAGGYRYAASEPVIAGMLLVIALTAIGGRGIPDLAPAIAELRLDVNVEWFTALVSATGFGSIAAGVWKLASSSRTIDRAIAQTRLFSYGMAASAAALALSTGLVPAAAACVALGFSITVTAVDSQMVIQSTVTEAFRGRVNAIYFLTFRGGTALGAFLMGLSASRMGLVATLFAGGALCLVGLVLSRSRTRPKSITPIAAPLRTDDGP